MTTRQRHSLAFLFVLAPACLFLLFAMGVQSQEPGDPTPLVLTLADAAENVGTASSTLGQIPRDCSLWWECRPTGLVMTHQEAYFDDGDGVVSVGDQVVVSGVTYTVTGTGPAYFTNAGFNHWSDPEPIWLGLRILVPRIPHNPYNPECENWIEIRMGSQEYPNAPHVEAWLDFSEDGIVSAGDSIMDCYARCTIGWGYYIDSVGVAVYVDDFGAVPVRERPWGWIKRQLGLR